MDGRRLARKINDERSAGALPPGPAVPLQRCAAVRPRFVTEVLDGVFDRALLLPGGFTVDNAAGGAVNGGTLTFTAQSLATGASVAYPVRLRAPRGVGFTAAYAFPANPDPFIFNNLGLAFSLTR